MVNRILNSNEIGVLKLFNEIKGEPQSKENLNYIEDISMFPKVTNVDFRDQTFFTALRQDSHPENASIK